ncbi:PKD domain-containing protein, partial [Flavobacterium sp. B17]|uniref:PKD domain-containing protein n=1 Tax=Flavobacterium sp. B17 TaxID=95618 RepID=UPI0005B2B29F
TWYINVNDVHTRFSYQIINVNTVQFTNQSSGATTFQWDFGDGTVSNIENPSHTYNEGTYDVKLTTNACGQLTTKNKKINITTLGTTEISKSDFKIYPVPTKDILKIKTDKKISGIEILDSNGKKINCKTVFSNDEYWISIHELIPGIYFITYTMNGIIYSEKFIKE